MKINNKYRLLILGIGFFITLWVCYIFALKKTQIQRVQYSSLRGQLESFEKVSGQLSVLQARESQYDSILRLKYIGTESLQNALLKVLNHQVSKHQISLIDFNRPHEIKTSQYIIKTYTFDLKGKYTSILKTVHYLEEHGGFGDVVHLDFNTRQNYKTRKKSLEARVFLQQWQ